MPFLSQTFSEDPITGLLSSIAPLITKVKSRLLVSENCSRRDVDLSYHSDFFGQYPRFAIHSPGFKQTSPVSVYMRYDAVKDLTYYIISGPKSDECVSNFQMLLSSVSNDQTKSTLHQALFQHPLDAHVLLSKIFCESSQGFINIFRQSMFAQVIPNLPFLPTITDRVGLATRCG